MENTSLAEKWDALLQLAKVHEPKLHEAINVGRAQRETTYNIQVVGRTAEECDRILRGLRIYGDVMERLTGMVWGEPKGIKVVAAGAEDFWLWASAKESEKGRPTEEELRRLCQERFYPEIRQQVEQELRGSGQLMNSGQVAAEVLTEMKKNQHNAEVQEKINLIGRGNQELTEALKVWEGAVKFVEDGDLEKLDERATALEEKISRFFHTLIKLEK